MLLLAIDTAGPACAVAVARDRAGGGAEIAAKTSEAMARGHAERLMPMIEAALRKAGTGFKDLDRVAVTTGPGSFTGVRVGIAAARGLALALDIPAIGIGSLEALAFPVRQSHNDGTAIAVLDARRDEVYARATDLSSGETLVEAAALTVTALAAKLTAAREPLVLIGVGAALLEPAIQGRTFEIVGKPATPDIEDVARLGLAAAADAKPPVPLYARDPDAKPQTDKAVARQ